MKITAFLPCRKGSQRVPKKNVKPFAGVQHGLIEIKLNQLLSVDAIDSIVLSTNDQEILDFAVSLNQPKLRVHKRAENLSSSETSTDDLVQHALDLIPVGHILWTHVTSPFLDASLYQEVINTYVDVLSKNFDSLMTTNLIHGFLWNEKGPLNYKREVEKWPRTQTLSPIHEINSAVFLSSCENYARLNDRIGSKPYLFVLDKIKGFDIDWEDDFRIAECLYNLESK